jgi:hypothetical protein
MELRKPAIFTGIAAAGLSYLLLVPSEYKIPCIFNYATGMQCPGCGLTRASMAILRGDFAAAFNFNPLIFAAPLFLAAYFLAKRSKYSKVLTLWLGIAGTLATIGFFLARNNLF